MFYIQTTVGMGPECEGEEMHCPILLIPPLTYFTLVKLKNTSVDVSEWWIAEHLMGHNHRTTMAKERPQTPLYAP